MSQQILASMLGMSNQAVCSWLSGEKKLGIDLRTRIADVLSLSLNDVTDMPSNASLVRDRMAKLTGRELDDARLRQLIRLGAMRHDIADRVSDLMRVKAVPIKHKHGHISYAKFPYKIRACQECGKNTRAGFICPACRGEMRIGLSAYARRSV